ncbi:MAG: glycosyltransferase family 2 protein [Flavobacteriales bacterium]|nr:glycosyltransferase family 2 protein [Flavobacteriales bacterium]
MTLYNKAPFVEEAVKSVLASSYTDFELLVLDDASTDRGADLVRAVSDPRIRLIVHGENLGRARNANRGLAESAGEYVAILDADDMMHADRLAKQVAYMDAHPRIGACGTAAQLIGDRDRVAAWPTRDEVARGQMLFDDPLLYGSAMFRRSVIVTHGLQCPEDWRGPGMDYLFLLRVAAVTEVANLPEALTQYRIGANNFRHGRNMLADAERIVKEALGFFGLKADQQELRSHLVLLRRLDPPETVDGVRSLNAWAARLIAFNREAQAFPKAVFESRLRAELDRIFFLLADHDPRLACRHARLSGGWTLGRLRYYLAARWRT